MQRRSGSGYLRTWQIALLATAVALLVVRLVAPAVIERVVEASLADMPDGYRATVADVELRLLAAEVALVGFKIEKKNGRVPVPYLSAARLVVGVVRDSWKPRATLRIVEPVVTFVEGKSEAESQSGPPVQLEDVRKKLVLELITLSIDNGQVHFRNLRSRPPLDASLARMYLRWDKLVACLPPGSSACRSTLRGHATLLESGRLSFHGGFARAPATSLSVQLTLRGLEASALSPILRQYAKLDLEGGRIDLDARYRTREKSYSALLVPSLYDVKVVGGEDGTSFFRELGVAAATGFFERRRGEKAIAIKGTSGGKASYSIVDTPKPSADTQKR